MLLSPLRCQLFNATYLVPTDRRHLDMNYLHRTLPSNRLRSFLSFPSFRLVEYVLLGNLGMGVRLERYR